MKMKVPYHINAILHELCVTVANISKFAGHSYNIDYEKFLDYHGYGLMPIDTVKDLGLYNANMPMYAPKPAADEEYQYAHPSIVMPLDMFERETMPDNELPSYISTTNYDKVVQIVADPATEGPGLNFKFEKALQDIGYGIMSLDMAKSKQIIIDYRLYMAAPIPNPVEEYKWDYPGIIVPLSMF